jgi:LmbE family N-acetylglucosaminyl deacetylase
MLHKAVSKERPMYRMQVVVAHPDDETFGCGSLLLHAVAQGATTSVVCATRGEEGGDADDLREVRERELRDRAMALHASQTSPYDGLPVDLRQAFLGPTYLRRVLGDADAPTLVPTTLGSSS